ncbi:MAG: type I restriction-modification system subunit M [Candidatus Aenigmatarchaeota archaeon]|nr:MAG: type I restriction-modification system subunit M [Candidatus Aenigmarchaeota archaeon]
MSGQSKISQKEINEVAWRACDTFRGVVDPAEYKNYILVFLFLKYISDVWKDKKEEYRKIYGDDEVRINRKMERERFIVPSNCDFDYIYSKRDANNIGEIINQALEAIEEANKTKLEGVFRNIDFNSEANLGETKDRNRRLKNLIEDFADPRLDLRPSKIGNSDIIGNTYEYLISRFASTAGKKGGEFYTPAEVSILIAKLLQPKSGERICDPACGSGSLLIKVANEIKDRNFSIFGQESNGSTWALCKMNMFLHGIDNARIEWGDTLNNPKLIQGDSLMKFDIVVANPPFSLDKWGAENAASDRFRRFHRGIPPKSKGDYAFISHMIETIVEDKGRVGVVVPHGVLFRGGSEGKIRQKLIEENLLDAVIGLPANLFFGVGIPVAILIFKKGRKTTDVLFIDASREFEKGTPQNKLRDEDIKKITEAYFNYQTIDKYAYRATFEEIKENEFNLNIPRYVDTFEEEEEVDIKATQKEIEKIEEELAKVRKEMDGYLKELGVN